MDSRSLVKVLEGMQLADGSPDIRMRNSAIQKLLDDPTLTFGELRLLKAHFDKRTFQCDIIAKLPVEILQLILQYVSLDGYITMRCVSRVWREKLASEDVYGTILRLHFRGIWEREYVPLDDTSKKAYLENIGTLIPSLCMKRQKRLGGQYHSMACYSFEGSFVQRSGYEIFDTNKIVDTETPERFQYKNGKLAVQVEDYCIVVNNLRTHVSMSCTEEHRRNFGHWMLSDSYLVAFVETRKPRLMAWSVDQEADPISIYLESLVKIVSVSGDRVVFSRNPTSIKNSSGLSIWHMGHSVQNIGMPSWIASSSLPGFRLGGVVFHPTNQDRLYAFYQPRSEPASWRYTRLDCSLYVQEYLHNTPQKMWFQDFECSWGGFDNLTCTIQVKAMDCDGLVSIWTGAAGHNMRDNGEPIQWYIYDPDVFNPNNKYLFASFNMFTGEFQSHANHMSHFRRNELRDMIDRAPLIWRDQILFDSADDRNVNDLVSLNNCDIRHRRVSVNLKKTFPSGLVFGWQAVGAAFVYNDLRCMIDPEDEGDYCLLGHVWGDDDFLVWACVRGYIVWSFDENVTLCKHQRINF